MNDKKVIPVQKSFIPDVLLVGILLMMIFIMGLQKNYSPDLGFHLRSAKWMIENKQFIKTDSFTYTSIGNNYYDLQWLYQLIIYALYKVGKDGCLIVVNALLISLSVFIAWMRAKKINNSVSSAIFALIVIFSIQALPFEIRPHVFSWIYLGILLFVLERNKRKQASKLFFLPVIMLLWVNSHSLAILGLIVIAIYNLGSYFETKKLDKELVRFSGLAFFAFFINPYFIDGFLFPFTQLGIIEGEALQKSYIGEIQSPFTLKEWKAEGFAYFLNPLLYLQLYSIGVLFVAVKIYLKKQLTESLLLISFFFITAMAIKNYGYLLVVSLPYVSNFINEWISARKIKGKKSKTLITLPHKRSGITALALAVMISWLCITDGFSILHHSPYRFGLGVDKQSVPADAVDFLNENNIKGKLMNHLDFGGYLMYHYSEPVFIDGRIELPKKEFFRKYFEALKPSGFGNLLNEYNPDIIIFPYNKAAAWWSNLLNNKNYRPVYFDGLAAVYLKNGKFTDIKELNEQFVNECIDTLLARNISDVIKLKKDSKIQAVLKSFFQKQYFPIDEQNKATFCFTYGYMKAALYFSALGIQRSTINPRNIFYNLQLYFEKTKRYQEAELCRIKSK